MEHARVNGVEDADIYYAVACIFSLRSDNEGLARLDALRDEMEPARQAVQESL